MRKRKLFKSIAALTMAGALMVGGLTGCGSEKKSQDADNTKTENNQQEDQTSDADKESNEDNSDKPDTWIADRTITVQVYVDDIGYALPDGDINETPVMKEITKRTGIKLDIQYTPGDSDSAVLASQLASGTIPDVIVSYLNDSSRKEFPLLLKAAKEEMFADVSSYLPNSKVYKKYLEEDYLPNDTYKNIVFRPDFNGAVYLLHLSIPSVDRSLEFNPEDEYLGGMYIQKSIVDKLGINPSEIRTQDQFYQLLVDIKNGGFTDDNGNPVYPLGPKFWGGSKDSLEYIVRGYNWAWVSEGYNIDEDGEIKHEVETDWVYKKVDFVRKLLAENLINPEFFTMDATRAEEVSRTHNSAIIADVHNYTDIIYETGEWVPLGPLNDYTGDNAKVVRGKTGSGVWAISAEAENPEEIFKFFDFLSTPEGKLLGNYGVEGISYDMVDGKPVVKEEVLEHINNGDNKWLINNVGASFGGVGLYFFEFCTTDIDWLEEFGESRPGSSAEGGFSGAIKIAEQYPVKKKLVPGLKATAYLTQEGLEEVNAQMSLLDYNETLVQAIYASSDSEAKAIIESFRKQLEAAGLEKFKERLKEIYEEDKESINFY